MGEVINKEKHTSKIIDVSITGSDRLKLVEIIKNGKSLKKYTWTDPVFSVSFTDDIQTGSCDYYYLRVIQQDNYIAWSSPIWVK